MDRCIWVTGMKRTTLELKTSNTQGNALMKERTYWVYIMTNRSGTLYVRVAHDLIRRVFVHRNVQVPGFTARYKITRLSHAESCSDVLAAIAREKEIKGWRREKKLALFAEFNPDWLDLAPEWDSQPGIQA